MSVAYTGISVAGSCAALGPGPGPGDRPASPVRASILGVLLSLPSDAGGPSSRSGRSVSPGRQRWHDTVLSVDFNTARTVGLARAPSLTWLPASACPWASLPSG